MKFPPASAKASKILRLSSFDAPQPHSSPKVMAPRHSSETRSPDRPRSLSRIVFLLSLSGDAFSLFRLTGEKKVSPGSHRAEEISLPEENPVCLQSRFPGGKSRRRLVSPGAGSGKKDPDAEREIDRYPGNSMPVIK